MLDATTLLTFLATVVALQTLPGPDMMLVIGRGVGQGWRQAFYCALGFSAAGIVQIPALALGVAGVFQTSPLAFFLLRSAGAVYLIYIGARVIVSAKRPQASLSTGASSSWSSFRQGFITNLTNPKVLVFLLAFLPQFTNPSAGSLAFQFVLLGTIMKISGLLVNGAIAAASGFIGAWLGKREDFLKWQQRFVGSLMVALGVNLLFDSSYKRA